MRNSSEIKLAKNFTLAEFLASDTADRLGIANLPNAEELKNLEHTARQLQRIRDYLNVSLLGSVRIKITSGFRGAALNKAVGGSATSDHRKGLAADFRAIRTEDGTSLSSAVLMRAVQDLGSFDQAIHYPGETRIHVGFGSRMRSQMLQKVGGGYEPYSVNRTSPLSGLT